MWSFYLTLSLRFVSANSRIWKRFQQMLMTTDVAVRF